MEDHYGPISEAAPSEAQDPPEQKTDESDQGEQTALIPKTLFGGKDFKVGEEIVLKITHLYETEAEVEYAPAEETKDKPKSAMDEAEGGLDRMAKPPMEG